jgi:hypothetical protein
LMPSLSIIRNKIHRIEIEYGGIVSTTIFPHLRRMGSLVETVLLVRCTW